MKEPGSAKVSKYWEMGYNKAATTEQLTEQPFMGRAFLTSDIQTDRD